MLLLKYFKDLRLKGKLFSTENKAQQLVALWSRNQHESESFNNISSRVHQLVQVASQKYAV